MADPGTHPSPPTEQGPVPAHAHPTLDAAAVRGRLASVSYESYLMLYSLMKSVSVAAAAFAIAEFAAAGEPGWWPELAFWVASFAGLILTYHAALVGSVIHELRFSLADSALPLSLCAVETLLFFVLANDAESIQIPTAWYLAFTCWAGIATTIIWRVRSEIDKQAETGADREVRKASSDYVERLTIDRLVAGALGSTAALLWLLKATGALDGLKGWEGVIGLVVLGALLGGLKNQKGALEDMRASVADQRYQAENPTA